MSIVGLIPARLQSTRLPRKLLLAETGKPLLQYVWEQVSQAQCLSRVIIATDSEEIAAVARGFGAECALTREHPSGTDRIAEVVRNLLPEASLVVNIQGDEPELEPANLDTLVTLMQQQPDAEMGTLATPIQHRAEWESPSCVKVVRAVDGRALYFSRCPIPYVRDHQPEDLLGPASPWLLHLGVYAYRREPLLRLTELPPSPLEQLEKLEQLRALEAGYRLQVAVVAHRAVGIDTPEDYAAFVARVRQASRKSVDGTEPKP